MMFWEKRKEKAAKYKVENENLAVPEIHLKGDDDADPAEVCGEDQDSFMKMWRFRKSISVKSAFEP